MKALYRVSAQEGNESIKWTHTIFVLLIILVELGPIIVKLLSPRGPYDARVDNENKSVMIDMDNSVIEKRLSTIQNRRKRIYFER